MLPLIVVDGDGPPLLVRNWLEQLKLNWCSIFHVSRTDTLSEMLKRHKNVFDKKLTIIKGLKTDKLPDMAKPVFCKDRPVPYALRSGSGRRDGPIEE